MTPEELKRLKEILDSTSGDPIAQPVMRAAPMAIPEPTANIPDPVKNNYNDQTAQRYSREADSLDQQAAIPAAKPKGVKENLVSAARAFMEGMARPQDPYAMENRREDMDVAAKTQLVNRAKALRGDAVNQQQLAQGERRQTFDERVANRPKPFEAGAGTSYGHIDQNTGEHTVEGTVPYKPVVDNQKLQHTVLNVKGRNEVWAVDMSTGDPVKKIGDAPPTAVSSGLTGKVGVVYTDEETGKELRGTMDKATGVITPASMAGDTSKSPVAGPTAGRELAKADVGSVVDAAGAQNLYNRMRDTLARIESGKSSAPGADDEALLAMHLSMTMGQVKGARTGRDVIEAHRNAIDPLSRAGRALQWLEGHGSLTPEQRHEFLDLAARQVENAKQKREDIHDFYNSPSPGSAPAPAAQPSAKPRIRIN